VGGGKFFTQTKWHVNRAKAFGKVFLVDNFYFFEVFAQGNNEAVWEHGDAVVAAFAIVDDDAMIFEINVFDS